MEKCRRCGYVSEWFNDPKKYKWLGDLGWVDGSGNSGFGKIEKVNLEPWIDRPWYFVFNKKRDESPVGIIKKLDD